MRLKMFGAMILLLASAASFGADPEGAAKVSSAAEINALPADTAEIVATSMKDTDLAALQRFKSLKTLVFHGGQSRFGALEFSAAGLEIVAQISTLETLGLPWNTFTDDDLAKLARLKNLRSLDLSYSQNLTDAGLKVLEKIPELNALNLSDCQKLSDAGVKIVSRLPHIQALYLNEYSVGLNLSDLALESIGSMAELETLEIRARVQFSSAALKSLAKLQKLTALTIRNQSFDMALAEISSLTSLSGIRVTSDDDFDHIGKLLKLQMLDVFGTFSGTGLKHLAQLGGLVNLTLDSSRFTDDGAAQLAGIKTLVKLSVHHANILSDAGLKHFAELKELDKLELTYCRQISADALVELRLALPDCDVKTRRCGRIDASSGAT